MSDTEPPLPQSQPDTVIPFQIPEKYRAIETAYEGLRDLDDVSFVDYHIAKWSHPSSLSDITNNIHREFGGPSHRSLRAGAESASRLIDLVTNVDLTEKRQFDDPLHSLFASAYETAQGNNAKIEALELLHALHLISTSDEKLELSEADKVVRIIAAILTEDDN